MKLFSILALSASATNLNDAFANVFDDSSVMRSEVATDFDGALAVLKTRYKDLKLRQFDNEDKVLKKTTRKMYRFMQRKKNSMERKGCWVSGVTIPYDYSVDEAKKCNVAQTLMLDIYTSVLFFLGSDPIRVEQGVIARPKKCWDFRNAYITEFYEVYYPYFEEIDYESTC